MEVKAVQKYVRMSPRKLRLVASSVKNLRPTEAVETLPHVRKRAAGPLTKVIKAAIANARQKGLKEQDLEFKEIQIGEGPRLKRGRPIARGGWHPIIKRLSHIRVVLEAKSPKNEKLKVQSSKSKSKAKSQKPKRQTRLKRQNK